MMVGVVFYCTASQWETWASDASGGVVKSRAKGRVREKSWGIDHMDHRAPCKHHEATSGGTKGQGDGLPGR